MYLLFSVAQQAVHGPTPGYWNTHIQPVPSLPAGGKNKKKKNIWVVGATQSTNVCLPLPVLESEVKWQHSFYMGNQTAPPRSSHLPWTRSIPPLLTKAEKSQLCWSGCPPLLNTVLPSDLTCLLSTTVVIPPCSTSMLSTGTATGTRMLLLWDGKRGLLLSLDRKER